MSKLAWERAAGSVAKLTTISVIAALAATTSLAANSAAPVKGQNAKVPASYGQPQFGAPTYGQPQFNAPAYGQPQFGAPVYGQPRFGAPVYGQPPLSRQQIAPATTSTFKPSTVTSAGVAPKLPLNAARPAFPAGQQFPQGPVAPQFGQPIPIFANTQANGITYGPPSYTPPKDFDPKTASSSPFPSDWHHNAWGQQHIQGQRARFQGQGRAPLPNLAGAPVYGNAWGQNPIAPASVSRFAPAEPSYAPAEPLRPNYTAAAPVYAPAQHAPAAPAKYESVDLTPPKKAATKVEPASTPTYSYDIAPSTAAPSYVGQSTQISSIYAPSATPAAPTTNPYEVVIGQSGEVKSYDSTSTAYQPAQAYEPAPAYQTTTPAPAPAPAPAYQAATPVPSYQAATPAPAYESAASTYQAAPAYETAASTYQAAPAYETAASTYQAAPAYETAAPSYETAVPAYQSQTSAYEAPQETAPAYQAASSYSAQGYETVTAAPAYEPAPAYETAAPAYTDAAAQLGYSPSSFSSGSDHFVQVGAFRNLQRAERLVRKLQGAGEQPIITQANVRGKLYHRVRVPAADRRDASNVQSRIRGLGYYEARTVRG